MSKVEVQAFVANGARDRPAALVVGPMEGCRGADGSLDADSIRDVPGSGAGRESFREALTWARDMLARRYGWSGRGVWHGSRRARLRSYRYITE